MALPQLLGDVSPGDFLKNYYLRLPFAVAGGCRHLTALGDWPMLDRLLADPAADVIIAGSAGQWPGPVPHGAQEARPLIEAGYTIGIRHAHRHAAELGALADEFQQELGGKVDIHLYCTPAATRGFGWHYDAEEVFVLQTLGSKEWSLRKNTVNPWPLIETLPADMRYEREIMPLTQCNLEAGDWLYIPAGYWHSTAAGSESISLSVGVAAPSGIDVLDFLRRKLLDSLRWRQRLPVAGTLVEVEPAQLKAAYQERLAELGRDALAILSSAGFASDFLESMAPQTAPRTTPPSS